MTVNILNRPILTLLFLGFVALTAIFYSETGYVSIFLAACAAISGFLALMSYLSGAFVIYPFIFMEPYIDEDSYRLIFTHEYVHYEDQRSMLNPFSGGWMQALFTPIAVILWLMAYIVVPHFRQKAEIRAYAATVTYAMQKEGNTVEQYSEWAESLAGFLTGGRFLWVGDKSEVYEKIIHRINKIKGE